MNYQCIFCQFRMFENLLENQPVSDEEKEILVKDFIQYLASPKNNKTAPQVARDLHAKIRTILKNPDPYKSHKKEHNLFMLNEYEMLKEKVSQAKNPFETALRLAISGNIIDYGPAQDFNIRETIEHVLNADFAINHSLKLKEAINKADTILYLGDNAGEIVADRLFIETIAHPNIYFAVRGAPIINDITLEDARLVKMHEIAHVIDNGYDAPSTILEKTSPEFKKLFNDADLVISKGQGNLEGLIGAKKENLFFLLMVKCDLIGQLMGVKKGDFVVTQNHFKK